MDPHVAVLVLDTPIEGIADHFGDFGDNVIALLKGSPFAIKKYQISYDTTAEAARPSEVNETNGTKAGTEGNGIEGVVSKVGESIQSESARRCDQTLALVAQGIELGLIKGLILTGSRSDSFATDLPWLNSLNKFIQETVFKKADFPTVGICFGHQVLAKNMGCKVGRNIAEHGWEAGIHTVALNKSILDIEKSPFRSALVTEDGKVLEHINLLEFHKDIVYCNPPTEPKPALLANTTFQNVGSTPKCSIQGLITESGPVKLLTFQGHPEFVSEQALMMLERLEREKLMDTATFERATYKTKNLENQGKLIGKVITDFLVTYYN